MILKTLISTRGRDGSGQEMRRIVKRQAENPEGGEALKLREEIYIYFLNKEGIFNTNKC